MSTGAIDRRSALGVLRSASRRWEGAVRAGEGDEARLQELAAAAEDTANAMRLVHAAGVAWQPRPDAVDLTLSYEFTAQHQRPGAKDPSIAKLWAGFDELVPKLGAALAGDSAIAVARAYEALSDTAREILAALEAARAAQTG
jgi:hypothetical protein